MTPPPAGYRAIRPFCRSNLATLAGVILFDERKVQYLRRDDEAYIPEPESRRSILAVAPGMVMSLTVIPSYRGAPSRDHMVIAAGVGVLTRTG